MTRTNPKVAIPILLFLYVFCLVIDNGFKTMTLPMAEGLGIPTTTASLQASLGGVVLGIGAVVYAALSDSIPIRRLLLIAIGLATAGSLLGFVFAGSWPMVLTARLVQTCGLAAAETLYVIYVTKYLPARSQKTYLGLSAASFNSGVLIGALTSGFMATYLSWTALFLIPLFLLLTIPVVLRTVPVLDTTTGTLDVVGLVLVAIFATSLTMFMQAFTWWWLAPAILAVALFAAHVRRSPTPLVHPEFFSNKRYVVSLALVFLLYSTQLGYIFLLPFAARDLHGIGVDKASLLMIPGYLSAICVGVTSGRIGRLLSSTTTIRVALGCITGSLLVASLAAGTHVLVLSLTTITFASGFALLYAPLVNTALSTIARDKTGIAIGFYNLTLNTAIPLGIAYTAALIAHTPSHLSTMGVLAAVAITASTLYFLADRRLRAAQT